MNAGELGLASSVLESYEIYRALAEESAVGVYLIQNGRFAYCNPGMAQVFGYSAHEIAANLSVAALVAPEDRELVDANIRRRLNGELKTIRYRFRGLRKDGAVVDVEVMGTLTNYQGAPAVIGTLLDISEQKRSEQERQALLQRERDARSEAERSRKQLQVLAEAGAILSYSLDLSRTLDSLVGLLVNSGMGDWCTVEMLDENGRIQNMASTHSNPLLAPKVRRMREDFPPALLKEHPLNRVLRTGESLLVTEVTRPFLERQIPNEEHRRRALELGMTSGIIVPLKTAQRIFGTIMIISSDSRRRFAREDLHLAEEVARRASLAIENALLYEKAKREVRDREEFLSVASHELKTPLTSLKLQAQLLMKGASDELDSELSREQMAKLAAAANERIDYFTRMVDTLLDLTRIQSGRFEVSPRSCDLVKLAREVLGAQGMELGMSSPESILGKWDPLRIQQVVANLLSNALKYGNGKPVFLALRDLGGVAEIEVRDEGHGIPKECLSKIYQPFERAGAAVGTKGLGLGLFIVRQIVEAHAGSIEVESALGKGSVFTVRLPK